jgi:translation elongation factor EF-Tu-like GTPase
MSILLTLNAKIYFLRTEEGGRQMPIFSGYCPVLYFGERQTNGAITPTAALA